MDHKTAIEEGLKKSLKERDAIRVSVLRMLLAAIKNKEVEKIGAITEDEFFALVKTSVKQHLESIESFKKGQRQELVEKEEKELEILKGFLPAQLSEEDLSREIESAIEALQVTSQKDMGKAIKLIMGKFPGRVDGKRLSEMVLKRLSSK
ncbi:MAG TPA: GatB/YqeY domain-containing protein [Syntrophorhabdaceae bacterium]|jgi:hypothetical protein